MNKPVETETASRPALGGRFCIPYSVFHILDFAAAVDGLCAMLARRSMAKSSLLRLFRSAPPAAAPAGIPSAAARVAIEHPLTRISSFPSEASVSCNFEMATHECRLTDHD